MQNGGPDHLAKATRIVFVQKINLKWRTSFNSGRTRLHQTVFLAVYAQAKMQRVTGPYEDAL